VTPISPTHDDNQHYDKKIPPTQLKKEVNGHDRPETWAAGKCTVQLGMGRDNREDSNVHENIEEIVTGKLAHSALPAGNCFETTIHVEIRHESSSRLRLIPSDREQRVY